MILDSSAIIAILLREPEADDLLERLHAAEIRGVGTATLVETGIVLSHRVGDPSVAWLHRFLQEFAVEVLPFTVRHWQEAIAAYQLYGRGRHPAALNLGDCFAYATAKRAGRPLLYVGEDFRRTDLETA